MSGFDETPPPTWQEIAEALSKKVDSARAAVVAEIRDGQAFRRWFRAQNYEHAPPSVGVWLRHITDAERETIARYLESQSGVADVQS